MKKYIWMLATPLVVSILACGVSSTDGPGPATDESGEAPAHGDVTIVKCGVDPTLGGLDIVVKVKNTTKVQQSYSMTAEALDAAGNRLGEASGAVNNLSTGETQVKLFGNLDTKKPIKSCRVADVTRFES